MFRIIIVLLISIKTLANVKSCDNIIETWSQAYTLNIIKLNNVELLERIPKTILNSINVDYNLLSKSDYNYFEKIIKEEIFADDKIEKYLKNDCSFVYEFIDDIIKQKKDQYLQRVKFEIDNIKGKSHSSINKFKSVLTRDEINQEIQRLVHKKTFKKSKLQIDDFLDLQKNLLEEYFSDLDYLISNAILNAFDPHSRQLTKKEQKSLMEEVQGKSKMRFGYDITKNDDGSFTFENKKEKILVTHINGLEAKNISTYNLMQLMDIHSVLDLTNKAKKITTIYKKEEEYQGVTHQYINKTLYLSFDSFYTDNANKSLSLDVYKLLEKYKKADSIVIDLRNNSGGSFLESIYLSSLFLEHNKEIILTKESSSIFINEYEIGKDSYSLFFKKPINQFNKLCISDDLNVIPSTWSNFSGEINTSKSFTCYFNQIKNNIVTMSYKVSYDYNTALLNEEQGEEMTIFNKKNNPFIPVNYTNKKPLIILTSKLSASSSEIFIMAMKDNNRALFVGDSSTFGKATIQSFLGDAAITTGKIFSPLGYTYQGIGFKPDIQIYSSRELADISESKLLYNIENSNPFLEQKINDYNDIDVLYTNYVKKYNLLKYDSYDRDILLKQDNINLKFIQSNIKKLTSKAKLINH